MFTVLRFSRVWDARFTMVYGFCWIWVLALRFDACSFGLQVHFLGGAAWVLETSTISQAPHPCIARYGKAVAEMLAL